MKMVEEAINECCSDSELTKAIYSIYKDNLDDARSRFDNFKAIAYRDSKSLKEVGYEELYFYLIVILEKFVDIEGLATRYKE